MTAFAKNEGYFTEYRLQMTDGSKDVESRRCSKRITNPNFQPRGNKSDDFLLPLDYKCPPGAKLLWRSLYTLVYSRGLASNRQNRDFLQTTSTLNCCRSFSTRLLRATIVVVSLFRSTMYQRAKVKVTELYLIVSTKLLLYRRCLVNAAPGRSK
jgi:hypothetical protein